MFSSYTFLQTMQNSFDSLVSSIVAQSVAHVFMSLLNICKRSIGTYGESAAGADTAQLGRFFRRNQSAVCACHNVPSDTGLFGAYNILSKTIPKCHIQTILPECIQIFVYCFVIPIAFFMAASGNSPKQ